MEEEYLGDGVYATFDGYSIKLDLRAQAPTLPITEITLEPETLNNLINFYNRMKTGPQSSDNVDLFTDD